MDSKKAKSTAAINMQITIIWDVEEKDFESAVETLVEHIKLSTIADKVDVTKTKIFLHDGENEV